MQLFVCVGVVGCSIIVLETVRCDLQNEDDDRYGGVVMKKDLLLTEKEERVKEAGKQGIISLVILLAVFVMVTIYQGLEIWYRSTEFMLFAVGMCMAALAIRPLVTLSSGQRALKERKKITENGRFEYGKVMKISETVGLRTMTKHLAIRYCVQMVYVDGHGLKKWNSSHYAKNPRDYIDIGKEYKIYFLGKKSCLEAVEAKNR